MYNLKVTSLVDDRRDPLKSTIAACEHMNDLYKMYKDWLLVLAAYNSGAGNVNKAIRRSGGKMNFWEIRQFLPNETRGYVPAFIGVTYVMSYAAEHNLRPILPRIQHYEIDTVKVKDLLTFNQISENVKVPVEELQFLNPGYKAGIIPATTGNEYVLRLPKKYIPSFVNNEAQLYASRAEKNSEREQVASLMKTVTQAEYHKVKRGENLGLIARKYRCTVNQLKKWNRLRSTTLAVGQRLIVRPESEVEQLLASNTKPVAKAKPVQEEPSQATEPAKEIASNDTSVINNKTEIKYENIYHQVKRGETLGLIAERNNVSISDLRQWNKIKGSNINAGQKIVIGKKEIIDAPEETIAQNKPTKTSSKSKFKYYTVQRGDTLWNIAQKHEGCSVEDIKRLNNIRNEKSLQPGQKIKVAVVS
jgi:membrane-bound lytic murein transglycosylase D